MCSVRPRRTVTKSKVVSSEHVSPERGVVGPEESMTLQPMSPESLMSRPFKTLSKNMTSPDITKAAKRKRRGAVSDPRTGDSDDVHASVPNLQAPQKNLSRASSTPDVQGLQGRVRRNAAIPIPTNFLLPSRSSGHLMHPERSRGEGALFEVDWHSPISPDTSRVSSLTNGLTPGLDRLRDRRVTATEIELGELAELSEQSTPVIVLPPKKRKFGFASGPTAAIGSLRNL
jgi:hypothetical protein